MSTIFLANQDEIFSDTPTEKLLVAGRKKQGDFENILLFFECLGVGRPSDLIRAVPAPHLRASRRMI